MTLVDMNELVELEKQTDLDEEVDVEYLEEIWQEMAKILSDDRWELADQEEHKNIENKDSEKQQRELSATFLNTTMREIMDKFM